MSTSITSSTLGKKTYKIIFLGDSGTGKTSIIERFVNNQFEEKENVPIIKFILYSQLSVSILLGKILTIKGLLVDCNFGTPLDNKDLEV